MVEKTFCEAASYLKRQLLSLDQNADRTEKDKWQGFGHHLGMRLPDCLNQDRHILIFNTHREFAGAVSGSPVTLRGVDDRCSVRRLQAQLIVSGFQIPLKRVHAADVKPNVALKANKCRSVPVHKHTCYCPANHRHLLIQRSRPQGPG